MSGRVIDCVEADEWQSMPCDVAGHAECSRRVCPSCGDTMARDCDERAYYWSELAEFTHALQLAAFGFCTCEDLDGAEPPYSDCPKEASA
jgi:hypothetical protein